MIKKTILFIIIVYFLFPIIAKSQNDEVNLGIRIQKSQKFYWENGITADYTSDFLLKKRIHLKASIVSSRLGTALNNNAIKQENYIIGADWRFRSEKSFQFFAGLNTGFFHADMEEEIFQVLPHNSFLLQFEGGLSYKFKFPIVATLSLGYNFIGGNGVTSPGTLFPVYYQLSVFYKIK
jgi:hypothetical protein